MANTRDFEKPWFDEENERIVLFRPHIPKKAFQYVNEVLSTRWIGQGPRVDQFESQFNKLVDANYGVAVGSGTDALHLSYLLAGLEKDDEVITTVFTCTATNIPLLYIGAKPVFVDIEPRTMNIDVTKIEEKITEKTKAISCVHYGGVPCDMDEIKAIAIKYNLLVIEDAAHAVGSTYKNQKIGSISDFTMFSFQAIKHITTGDGGFLTIKNKDLLEKSKRLRWFGIDRSAKQLGIWENDIKEIGYKYQMTDISAALGLSALEEWDVTLELRQALFSRYVSNLKNISGIYIVGSEYVHGINSAWLLTVLVDNPRELQAKLRANNIESNQVHFRNDRYSIFGGNQGVFPVMDDLEKKYLVLPLHTFMSISDVDRICDVIKSGW